MCNECCGDFLWSVEKWVLCRWVFIDDEIGVFVLLLEMESIGCKIANIAMWGGHKLPSLVWWSKLDNGPSFRFWRIVWHMFVL